MKNPKLATRYAQALFDFSNEMGKIENVYQDICTLQKAYLENHELKTVIESPVIPHDKKNKIFRDLFENEISEISYGFLRLIIHKRREPQLQLIFHQFIQIYYRHNHIKEAYITSVSELSENTVRDIKAFLENQSKSSFIIHQKIDPQIIGGIIIKIDDFIFDSSILTKINKLKFEFSHNVYQSAF